MSEPILTGLTDRQADGQVCVWCSQDHDDQVPVGTSETGSQVFACTGDCAGIVWAFGGFERAGVFATLAEMRLAWDRQTAERDR